MSPAELIQRAWRRWNLLPGPGQMLRKLLLRGSVEDVVGTAARTAAVSLPRGHER